MLESLGEREREVLRLLAEGLTYGEIAGRLVVSLNTVRFHVKNIYGKLGVDRPRGGRRPGEGLGAAVTARDRVVTFRDRSRLSLYPALRRPTSFSPQNYIKMRLLLLRIALCWRRNKVNTHVAS